MPKQNRVAEQANWKVEDKLCTLLKDAEALDFLWADAGAVATYAINHTVSVLSGGVTPYKAFYGVWPSVNHMQVWYCDMFIHCRKTLGAQKLGEQGKPVKFLSYPENVSGYRTYDLVGRKVEVVPAPIFCEEAHPSWNIPFELTPDDSESDVDDDNIAPCTMTPSHSPEPSPTSPPSPAPDHTKGHPHCV